MGAGAKFGLEAGIMGFKKRKLAEMGFLAPLPPLPSGPSLGHATINYLLLVERSPPRITINLKILPEFQKQ